MPLYSSHNRVQVVYELAKNFIININDEDNYKENREDIIRNFTAARVSDRSIIEKYPDIHKYLSDLSSEEVKLASVSRRLKRDNTEEDTIENEEKLRAWFKQQEDEIKVKFKARIED